MRHLLASIAAPFLAGCACLVPTSPHDTSSGGEPASSALYREISDRDVALTAAFNAHDLRALMALFADDVEFYHDTGGLQHYAEVRAGFGNLFGRNDGIRRNLVAGSLRVFPIKGYGAIELGSHRFCHEENAKEICGTFAFVQLWRQSDAGWKIARVVSYGH